MEFTFSFGGRAAADPSAPHSPAKKRHASDPLDCPADSGPGVFALMAVQPRLGILPKRRARIGLADRIDPVPDGKNLTFAANSRPNR